MLDAHAVALAAKCSQNDTLAQPQVLLTTIIHLSYHCQCIASPMPCEQHHTMTYPVNATTPCSPLGHGPDLNALFTASCSQLQLVPVAPAASTTGVDLGTSWSGSLQPSDAEQPLEHLQLSTPFQSFDCLYSLRWRMERSCPGVAAHALDQHAHAARPLIHWCMSC